MFCLPFIYLPGKQHVCKKGIGLNAVHLFLYFTFSDANFFHHNLLQVLSSRAEQVIIYSLHMGIPIQ